MLRRTATASFLVLAVVGSLFMGTLVGFFMPRDDDFFELRKNFQIFGAAYEELVTGYVEPLDPEHLMRTGIDAMLAELDPYTTFIDEADNADLNIITRGRYGGVGLNVGKRGGKVTVLSPIEGASGYKQGVRAGDLILEIEDQSTDELSMADVRTLLRGEPGTTVNIVVGREGVATPIDFTLTREQVKLNNVTYTGFVGEPTELGGVGYVKLERFTREAGGEVRDALRNLQEDRSLRGLVLDLRGNPGGLLDAAVDVTELFVPRGSVIVSTRGRLPETERTYRSDRAPMLPDVPMIVLVDGFSASASEIVAGAIQDLDRGVVMGTTTYGKGLVQVVRSLPHNTSLKMTTAKYYTPSGRSIQSINYSGGESTAVPDSVGRSFETVGGRTVRDQHGIEPDITVPEAPTSELEEALQRRAAFFFYANHVAAQMDSLRENYQANDTTLRNFREWLEEERFTYPTDAEMAFDKLSTRFADDGYDDVSDEVARLQTALRQEKMDEFEENATALKRHLEREILARFVPERARIERTLDYDVRVASAIDLFDHPDRYASILSSADDG
ncbi:carboxyl-terminal protease [Longibacter salinarum]|uniref:Carboxyl-terminal protease n=1 Tax=Longibacter salinarum TaxID=1850348 RepID=A0A2A8CY79_9BACT|nr:S41 family peptidase [Longibacter salinarum]PEN13571.1 carboxyl-terminal protease [Longibacter salinarum]